MGASLYVLWFDKHKKNSKKLHCHHRYYFCAYKENNDAKEICILYKIFNFKQNFFVFCFCLSRIKNNYKLSFVKRKEKYKDKEMQHKRNNLSHILKELVITVWFSLFFVCTSELQTYFKTQTLKRSLFSWIFKEPLFQKCPTSMGIQSKIGCGTTFFRNRCHLTFFRKYLCFCQGI